MNLGLLGLHRTGQTYIRAALNAVESRPRDEIWARTVALVGIGHYSAGRLDEAEAIQRDAMGMLDKGADYISGFSHHCLRHLYGVRGNIPLEIAEAEAEFALGTARGDEEVLAWGTFGKANALARSGQTDLALELAQRSVNILRQRKSMAEAVGHGVLGFARIQASDYAAARTALEESARLVRENFYRMEFVGPTYPLLVESLLGPRWADRQGGPGRAVARKAWREGRFARFIGWTFPNYGAHALRVSARAAFALNNTGKAARYIERAIVAAESHGARYELARALLDAARIVPERADEYRRRGQRVLDELGAVVPEAERDCDA